TNIQCSRSVAEPDQSVLDAAIARRARTQGARHRRLHVPAAARARAVGAVSAVGVRHHAGVSRAGNAAGTLRKTLVPTVPSFPRKRESILVLLHTNRGGKSSRIPLARERCFPHASVEAYSSRSAVVTGRRAARKA